MTARVTVVINQKGGVGKSTTALALMAGLTERGLRTLAVDLDQQCNLSRTVGADQGGATSYGVLLGECGAASAVRSTRWGDVIPAAPRLARADRELSDTGREYVLRDALAPLLGGYDHIVVDTPPSLGILTANAMTAATGLVVPAQADVFSLDGIDRLAGSIGKVRTYCNAALRVDGILLTRYTARSVLTRELTEMIEEVASELGTSLYRARIREAVAVREAQACRRSIFEYAPRSGVAGDYRAFIDEFLEGTHESI